VRQAAIEAAHLEGFNRSARDVTLRRLISFALSTTLKNSFEQIFSPPIMVESIFAELGETPAQDVLVRVHYDGHHHYEASGALVAHSDAKQEEEAGNWIRQNVKPDDSLARVASVGLTAWRSLTEEKSFSDLAPPNGALLNVDGKIVEAALLDRKSKGPVHYRSLNLSKLKD
jgi:proteasome alpha subunit